MDVKNIITFLEVADTRSFSVSAGNLNITQPAVSKRVAALEEQLSTRLFDRIGKKVFLTESAQLLIPSARKIVSEVGHMEEIICHSGSRTTGNLRISVTPYIAACCLPDHLSCFNRQCPEVDIKLEVKDSASVLEGIQSGVFEIGLCELAEPVTDGFSSHSLKDESLNIVVAPTHSLTKQGTVTPQELAAYRSILPPPGTPGRVLLSKALSVSGYVEKNAIAMPNYTEVAQMVETGLGWGILPQSYQGSGDFVVLTVEGINLELHTYIIRQTGLTMSQAAVAFVDLLQHRPHPFRRTIN